jgi:hypothetical protein
MRLFVSALTLLFLSAGAAAQGQPSKPPSRTEGPMVFISGQGPTSATAGGIGTRFGAIGGASVGSHDETMEVASDLLKKCPEISLTVNEEAEPDYILLLHRSAGGFFAGAASQFMLLRRDKSVLYANEKSSSMKASRDACKTILSDWKRSNDLAAKNTAPQQRPNNLPEPRTDGWWKSSEKPAQTEAQK